MNFHWIFEVDSKFSPLWMEWLPSPSILCPLLHQFTSQLCTSCCVLDLEGFYPVQDQTLFKDMSKPHMQISGYSLIHPIPLFPASATQTPAIFAALNSELCLIRGKPLVSAWVQPICSTVRKMPQHRKLGWSSLRVFPFSQESQSCTACLSVPKSSYLIFSSFIVIYIRRKCRKQYLSHSWIQKYIYHLLTFWLHQV